MPRFRSRSPMRSVSLTIWQLYVVGFVNGVADGLLRRGLPVLPAIARGARPVDRGQLEAGGHAGPSPRAPGPAIGGGLIGLDDARPIAIVVDAISFLRLGVVRVPGSGSREAAPDRHVDEHGQAAARACARRSRPGCAMCWATATCAPSRPAPAPSNLFSSIAFAIFLVYAGARAGPDPARSGSSSGSATWGALAGAVAGRIDGAGSGSAATIVVSRPSAARGSCWSPSRPRTAPVPFLVAAGCRRRVRRRGLQHQPGQLPPGDHARSGCRAG